jgi:hypothetical protein
MGMIILSVIGVTILNIILGMLWYSPWLFGHEWAKAYKFDKKKLKATPWHLVGSILVSLVTAIILATLVHEIHITHWRGSLLLAIYLWIGFIVTTHFSGVIWARKPLRVYFIDIAYLLISLVMMTMLLTAWQ